jgi:hypothetical protein
MFTVFEPRADALLTGDGRNISALHRAGELETAGRISNAQAVKIDVMGSSASMV